MSEFEQFGGPQKPQQYVPVQTSGKATASLILGLLSFCLSVLTGLPAVILGMMALGEINRSRGRVGGKGLAIGGVVTGSMGIVFGCFFALALLLPAVQGARDAARRQMSTNNLKMIGLAIHNYHDTYMALPLAGSKDPDVGLGLSWRVRILPFIEEHALFDRFNFHEPWDSPHNQSLIPLMPEVYQSPNRDNSDYKTVYLGVATPDFVPGAPNTVFNHGARPSRFADIIDGTTNTIMVVEADADQAVIWTKPDDWEMDSNNPRRGLGNLRRGGFLALFADASVYFVPNSVDDEDLRALLYRDSGKMVRFDFRRR